MKNKVEQFRKIVNEMADLYEKKNSNYGDSFGKLVEDLGPVACLVPLHNKLDRATNLIKGGNSNFESLEDTLKDLACYAIMSLIELHKDNNEEKYITFVDGSRMKMSEFLTRDFDSNEQNLVTHTTYFECPKYKELIKIPWCSISPLRCYQSCGNIDCPFHHNSYGDVVTCKVGGNNG